MLMQGSNNSESICSPNSKSLQRSNTCIGLIRNEDEYPNYKVNMDLADEIREFAERKKQYVLSTAQNEDAWREAIRSQLEEELDKRVKDALNSPLPSEEERDDKDDELQFGRGRSRMNSKQSFSGNQFANNSKKHWRVEQAERKLRQYMEQGEFVSRTKRDYVLNTDLLQFGGIHETNTETSLFGNLPSGIKSHLHYSNVAKKAERNIGSLSTVERYEFFYAFTKNGFREAQSLGRLPDGSELKLEKGGKYKDRYGIIRDEHGPFWPNENGPLFPPPTCVKNGYNKHELVLDPENIEKFKQTVDNQQTPFIKKWRGVQIIFDSEKSGRNYEAPPVSEDHAKSLLFESRFESGNLRQARRIGEFEYELVLKTDLYTNRHTQWYYFQVTNVIPGVTYRFKIVNLLKKTSLYNFGMRPLLYSTHNANTKNTGWVRAGHHISYYRNEHNLQCPLLLRDRAHFVLEWQMEFANAEDTYYLAHCYPYTFTDLKDDLETLNNDPERSKVMKQEVMCETRAGNSCFLITVTNFEADPSRGEKKGVVVTARVHPGETNSSWMMKGLLDFITGKTACAKELRSRFIFKIVPMLNPDGVIVGNYRCSLAGRDLNRNYRRPRKESFPTIWHTKAMLEDLAQSTEVLIYCDLHGHSRKQNVFMYGCNHGSNKQFFGAGAPFTPTESFLKERLFPWLMAQKAPDKFSFRGCRFAVRKCKEATGRVVMFRQMEISNSFTMEATFCGTNICRGDRRHFNIQDFELMGRTFCEVVLDYNNTQSNKEKQTQMVLDMTRAVTQQVLEARGLLSKSLPDFTTEKGREMLKDYCQGQKGLSASEQYAIAFMNLVKKERDNLAVTSTNNGEDMQKLLDMMSGDNTDYLQILDDLQVNENEIESDSSSDSDSESEPEMIYQEPKIRRKKKNKKKSKGGNKDSHSGKDSKKKSKDERPNSTSALPSISSKIDSGKRRLDQCTPGSRRDGKDFAKSFPGFVNKYIGRSNGGIPCFSEERLLARAAKRMEEMKKRVEDEQIKRDNIYFGENGDNMTYVYSDDDRQRGAVYPQTNSAKSLTSLDMKSQLQQGIDKSYNVRTGYMHAYDGTTSDTESETDFMEMRENLHRHSVAAMNSPYGNLTPSQIPNHNQSNSQYYETVINNNSNSHSFHNPTVTYSNSSKYQQHHHSGMTGSLYSHMTGNSTTAITAQILNAHNQNGHNAHHVNVAPQKISREAEKEKLLHQVQWPPYYQAVLRRKLYKPTRRLPPLPYNSTDVPYTGDSCSIPLRHTTQHMSITPRGTSIASADQKLPNKFSNSDNSNMNNLQQNSAPVRKNGTHNLPKSSHSPNNKSSSIISSQVKQPHPPVTNTSHLNVTRGMQQSFMNQISTTGNSSKPFMSDNVNCDGNMTKGIGEKQLSNIHRNIYTPHNNQTFVASNLNSNISSKANMAKLQGEYSELLVKHLKGQEQDKSMMSSQINGQSPANFMPRRKQSERHATCE